MIGVRALQESHFALPDRTAPRDDGAPPFVFRRTHAGDRSFTIAPRRKKIVSPIAERSRAKARDPLTRLAQQEAALLS